MFSRFVRVACVNFYYTGSGYDICDGAQVASTMMVPLFLLSSSESSLLDSSFSFSSFVCSAEIIISLISLMTSGVRRLRK